MVAQSARHPLAAIRSSALSTRRSRMLREKKNDIDCAVGDDSSLDAFVSHPRPKAVDEGLERLGGSVFAVFAAHTGTWFAA